VFYLVKPPVNLFDVAAAHAAVGSVHRDEGILAVRTPDVVAKAFGALVEGAFVVCHQHDPVRADVELLLMESRCASNPVTPVTRCASCMADDATVCSRRKRHLSPPACEPVMIHRGRATLLIVTLITLSATT
jgi:hypothetical protein